MKIIVSLLLIVFSFKVHALSVPCESELARYKNPGVGFINICTDNKNKIAFRATSFGNRGHTCNARGKATLQGNKYIYKRKSCTISFEIKGNELNVVYDNCWRGFCGMDATWNDGVYKK